MFKFCCRAFVVGILFTMAISHLSYEPTVVRAAPTEQGEIGVDAVQGWPALIADELGEVPEGCVSLRRRGGSC